MEPNHPQYADTLGYRLLRIASERFDATVGELSREQRLQAESIAAREFVLEQAVLNSREARQVVVADSQLEQALEQIRSRYSDKRAFQRALADNDLREADIRGALSRELRADAVLTLVGNGADPVDDTEVGLYYYMHPDKFRRPETRVARHILITLNPDFPENTAAAARQRMNLIAKRLARHPHRFAEQALKHSECPTSLRGGLLGRVGKGKLYPQLDAALFAMKEGAISDVLDSPVGLHLLLCEKIYPAGLTPLSDILPPLREKLTERRRRQRQRRWLETVLKTEYPDSDPHDILTTDAEAHS